MKICNIHLEDHPFFGTLDINLTDPNGNTLDTVVIAGINGSGKTTVLNSIFNMLEHSDVRLKIHDKSHVSFQEIIESNKFLLNLYFSEYEIDLIEKNGIKLFSDPDDITFHTFRLNIHHLKVKSDLNKFPKCVLLPTEIKFNQIAVSNVPFKYEYKFFNVINEEITRSIPDYFGTYIDQIIYSNENTAPKLSIQKACEEINSIFEKLDLESRLIGLKKDGSRIPIFKNNAGEEFEISGLSSGEKQLFFRIMALKMVEANNSIILIDEPEISIHPAWQQKILKVYENIGENNQVIVATHSPHIIGSTNKENVKLLIRDEKSKRFVILGYEDIGAAKGTTTERILKDLMGLQTTRDPDIQSKIDYLWDLIKNNIYETDEFKEEFKFLEDLIEPIDEDLVLMKLEIGKRNWERGNAKNQ
jgi:predicted ATP-binding protein involved in virulence